jgi:hypothetical protein
MTCPTCDARIVLCGTRIDDRQPLYCCTGVITHWWQREELVTFTEPAPVEVQQELFI